ncbi:toprim domain-containing protein [Niveibacterium sp. SC-1]|uniref:toprim domain-containing protein n=1 Tax=Niveibacterium sp. SC-1 TaxID=3135646 RepID=UPI00311EE833
MQMEAFGIELRDKDKSLRVDSKRHTCGKGGKAWYKLHAWRPDAGGCFIVGSFGSYKTGEWEKVALDLSPLSEAERARRQMERIAREAAAKNEREREAESAALQAADIWHKAKPEGECAYLRRKGIERAESVRFDRGWLRIPMLRYDLTRSQALVGIQTIKPDGAKLFTSGMAKRGAACRLGLVVAGEPILVSEGYATGMTVRMAIRRRWPVFVAFDANNLEWVVHVVQKCHPQSPILICADDDWRTDGNPGRTKGWALARRLDRVQMVYPVFGAERGPKDTDFNDLHAREGLDAVARQLAAPLTYLLGAPVRFEEPAGVAA